MITIARMTNANDTFDTAPVNEKIDFNESNDVDTTKVNAFITQIQYSEIDGIGDNQGAEQNLGDQQALGLIEDTIKITGFITKRNATSNIFLSRFANWRAQPKINEHWPLGRFGIVDTDDETENEKPINKGNDRHALLWERIQWTTNFEENIKEFVWYLRRNRGDELSG